MFEFFIALFGGVFSVGKILADRNELKNAKRLSDRRCEIWQIRFQAWRNQVEDLALQEDLWDYITNHENKEAVWLEIRDAYENMHYNKSYASANEWLFDGVLDKTKTERQLYNRRRFGEPLDIMLAKRGKLRNTVVLSPAAYLDPGNGQRTKNEWDRTVEFWVYIRDELRRNGVNAKLLFERQNECGLATGQHFDVDDIDKFAYQRGKLVWLPASWVDSDLSPL